MFSFLQVTPFQHTSTLHRYAGGMSFRNPSPPLDYECEPTPQPNATVAPLILRLVENVIGGNIDGPQLDSIEDTPLERTLCAAWDLASIDEYAAAMLENNIQVIALKVSI